MLVIVEDRFVLFKLLYLNLFNQGSRRALDALSLLFGSKHKSFLIKDLAYLLIFYQTGEFIKYYPLIIRVEISLSDFPLNGGYPLNMINNITPQAQTSL
jgi:hypothetical protein